MQVLHDRVLLKKIEQENKSQGGIVLAKVVDEVYEATVVSVGEGKPVKNSAPIPLTVKAGDRVMYNPQAVIPVTVDGENYLVIKEEEIFAVLDPETK